MYNRLDDVTCIGNLFSGVNFMKPEKVVHVYEWKILSEHASHPVHPSLPSILNLDLLLWPLAVLVSMKNFTQTDCVNKEIQFTNGTF